MPKKNERIVPRYKPGVELSRAVVAACMSKIDKLPNRDLLLEMVEGCREWKRSSELEKESGKVLRTLRTTLLRSEEIIQEALTPQGLPWMTGDYIGTLRCLRHESEMLLASLLGLRRERALCCTDGEGWVDPMDDDRLFCDEAWLARRNRDNVVLIYAIHTETYPTNSVAQVLAYVSLLSGSKHERRNREAALRVSDVLIAETASMRAAIKRNQPIKHHRKPAVESLDPMP